MGFLSDIVKTVAGPLIGGVGSLLGGKESSEAAREVNDQNTALQREFAQQGIRWKVEDAKAAGLHPLFAVGGQGAAFTPSAISVGGSGIGDALQTMGQAVSRAVQAQQTSEEREKHEASLQVLRAQAAKDVAQAAYYDSLASRGSQGDAIASPLYGAFDKPPITFRYLGPEGQNPRSGNGPAAPLTLESYRRIPGAGSQIELRRDQQITNRRGDEALGASQNPFWNEHVMLNRNGRYPVRVMLPRSDEGPGEALENLGVMSYPAFFRENVQRYGWSWLADFFGMRDGRKSKGSSGKW